MWRIHPTLELQSTLTHKSPDSQIQGRKTLRLQVHFADDFVTPGLSSSYANVIHDLELVLSSWTSVSQSEKMQLRSVSPGSCEDPKDNVYGNVWYSPNTVNLP